MERKIFPAKVMGIDEAKGIVEAIVAVMGNIDDGDDVIHLGAFRKTLAERGRDVRVLDAHRTDSVLAAVGVPLEMREIGADELPADLLRRYPSVTGGLYTKTQYLIDTPEGAGVFKRIAVGAISQYSIGYDAIKGGTDFSKRTRDGREVTVRNLRELKLYEYSPVLFAMNTATTTLAAKSTPFYQNLPLSFFSYAWDAAEAEKRVREWAGGGDGLEGMDWERYGRAFLWHDAGNPQQLDGYKFGCADVIDGELYAVPQAILALDIEGASISEESKAWARAQATRYCEKMLREFAGKEMTEHGPARRLLDVFTGTIHYGYTTMADSWLIAGIISHDERMEIGRLTGEALAVITGGMAAELAGREIGGAYYNEYAMMGAAGAPERKGSMTAEMARISRAFDAQFNTDEWHYWLTEVFEDYVIVGCAESQEFAFYQVAYTQNEGGDLIFAAVPEWVGGALVFTAGMKEMPLAVNIKAGRVLAQRNANRILTAMQMLQEALADAGLAVDDGGETEEMTNNAPPDEKGAALPTGDGAGPDTPPTRTDDQWLIELEMLQVELSLLEV